LLLHSRCLPKRCGEQDHDYEPGNHGARKRLCVNSNVSAVLGIANL